MVVPWSRSDALERLTAALELASDCHVAYLAVTPDVRGRMNQTFFERIEISHDDEVGS